MKMKTVVTIAILMVSTFMVTLAVSFINTSDLLDKFANVMLTTEKRISLAKDIKSRLLDHNRNSLLYNLNKKQSRFEKIKKEHSEIFNVLARLDPLVTDTNERDIFIQFKNKIPQYLNMREKLLDSPKSAIDKYIEATSQVDELEVTIDKMISVNNAKLTKLIEDIDEENRSADLLALLLLVGGVITTVGLGVGFFYWIYNPITTFSNEIEKYKNGKDDVKVEVKGLEEIKIVMSNFNSMVEHLNRRRQDQIRFVASIVHDIRNPLNAVMLASEILIDSKGTPNYEMLRIINQQTIELNRLLEDLLDTTRIEAGELDLEFSETNINELIVNSAELFKTTSKLHKIDLSLSDSLKFISCDKGRISQVLNNIISNAIKYSPHGGVVSIDTSCDHANFTISVKDQGVGIDESDYTNIFKPFHRTKATKETIPGIGLGLSSSRKIIEGHGGQIKVISQVGMGTCFNIVLPVTT